MSYEISTCPVARVCELRAEQPVSPTKPFLKRPKAIAKDSNTVRHPLKTRLVHLCQRSLISTYDQHSNTD